MNRQMVLDHLRLSEEHVAAGETTIARQREVIAQLESGGHDTNEARANAYSIPGATGGPSGFVLLARRISEAGVQADVELEVASDRIDIRVLALS